MERTIQYYLIESHSDEVIERIWYYCNYMGKALVMYKTRITRYQIGWVVELPDNPMRTAFLLNFGQYVSAISAPYYASNSGANYYFQGS